MVLCGVSRYKASCSVWEVISGGRLVAQFIRRNVILVHCTAQTEPLQSDAGGAVDDENFDAGSFIHYIWAIIFHHERFCF